MSRICLPWLRPGVIKWSVMTESLNIDPAEVAKFDNLASRWWDTESEFKPLHDINPLRLEFIRARTQLADRQVLDVGCGGGILSESLAASGARVTGIDMGSGPLAVAKLHSLESGVEVDYHQVTAEQHASEAQAKYDVVVCMEMLEHVPVPESVINACARLVKPGGDVFFSTINRNAKSYLFAVLGAEYVLGLLPKGTHNYGKFIRPSEMASWSRHAGLTLKELKGLSYNPISREYHEAENIDVNYLAHFRKTS